MAERESHVPTIDAKVLRQRILGLAWPVMAEMFLQTFTQIVSMALVGHLGANAVASIGLSMQPLQAFQGVFMGIAVGGTAIVARYFGAGDQRYASRAAAQAVMISVFIAGASSLLMTLEARRIVIWMGAEASVIEDATRYLVVMVPGLLFMWVSTVLNGALRGAGDTKTPMKVNIVINLISFAGNILLVYGLLGFPAMGTYGAGVATTIARVFGGFILFIPYLRNRTVLSLQLSTDFKPDKELILRVSRISIPAALERMTMSAGQLFYTKIVAGLGTLPYAAHVIGMNAESISYMPGNAFSTASTTLSGQNLGAGRPDLAERSTYETLRLSVLFMQAMGLIMFFFPGFLIRIYTQDPDIIALGSTYLRIMGLTEFCTAVGFVFQGALRGAGQTGFVLYSTMFTVWVVRLGLTYVLVHMAKMNVIAAWIAMAADWAFRALLSWLYYRAGYWKKTAV